MAVNLMRKEELAKASSASSVSTVDPMVKYVVEEFERYEAFHSDRFQKAAAVYNDWLNMPPKRDYSWQNAVHVPVTFESEQTITPRIFAALFPDEAPIDIVTYGQATEEQGIVIKSTIKHYFRVSDVQGEAIPALTQCSLLGTGYLEAPWLYKTEWKIGQDGNRYQALVHNRPDCKAVSFFEFFPHPAKMSMDDGLPIIRRRFCDAEYLKRLQANPQFRFQNLKEALNSEPTVKASSIILGPDGVPLDLKKREQYELLEYWGPWDLSYKKDEVVTKQLAVPHWIIIVNRKVNVRGVPNPFNHQRPPFCKFTMFPDAKPNWFGVGIGQVGKPTQDRLNKIVNQRLDNVDLVMNKQGFYNGSDTMINVRKLQISKPGLWHKVADTTNSIKWMDIPDVTASSYEEEKRAKEDYREATGATVPLMPADEGQHRTASGINLLQGAAGMRFRPILRKMETDLIQDLAMIYFQNLQQFMVVPEWIEVEDDQGNRIPVQVTPEQIKAKAMFIPTGLSEMMNREVQIGQLLRFKEVTMQDPTINRAEINKRIAKLMGFKDISKIIVPQQPVMAGQGQLTPAVQQQIQQRLAEGASPDQIKMELLGNKPVLQPTNPK